MDRTTFIRFKDDAIPEFLESRGIPELKCAGSVVKIPAHLVRVNEHVHLIIEDISADTYYHIPLSNVRYYYTYRNT